MQSISPSNPTPPPFVQEILDDLDLPITECRPVGRERDELVDHYRLVAEEGVYFLKVRRPETGAIKSVFHRLFGHPSMQRQIDVHNAFQRIEHGNLRIPRLLDSDADRFMLLEYIPLADYSSTRPEPDTVVAALLEFQRFASAAPAKRPGLALLDVALHPEIRFAHAATSRLRRRLGTRVAIDCLAVLWQCRRAQPRLSRTLLVHNDFHPENVLVGSDQLVYLTDFENVTTTRRWVLTDIVHYAVSTREARIDTELIRRYARELRDDSTIGSAIRMEAQVRFALLRRIVQHVTTASPPGHVRTAYARFLTDTLLPDRAFEDWHADRFT